MAKQCDVCSRSFKNSHGVSVHKMRTPACGGTAVSWGAGKKSTGRRPKGSNGESGREAIRQILTDHPQGLPASKIFEELQKRGLQFNPNYVSQAAGQDPNLIRVGRGVYRLKGKGNKKPVAQTTTTAIQTEVQTEVMKLPREALLLRIEILETQNRALQDAHLSLMRGVFV